MSLGPGRGLRCHRLSDYNRGKYRIHLYHAINIWNQKGLYTCCQVTVLFILTLFTECFKSNLLSFCYAVCWRYTVLQQPVSKLFSCALILVNTSEIQEKNEHKLYPRRIEDLQHGCCIHLRQLNPINLQLMHFKVVACKHALCANLKLRSLLIRALCV